MLWKAFSAVLAGMNQARGNMNGVYFIQNGNSTDSRNAPPVPSGFSTNFSSYPTAGRKDNYAKYVEAYSEEISTLYSQIWWTMGPIYTFPDEFIKVCSAIARFK